jgi:hypothetical protein
MEWFIRRGDTVQENHPFQITFRSNYLVSAGKPTSASIRILCDSESLEAPVHEESSVRKLVKLEADLTHLTSEDLSQTIEVKADEKE